MARAAQSSSRSSPQLVAEDTVPYLLLAPTQQRYCSTDDVMRRAPAVDAPPPVACARTRQAGTSAPLVSAAIGRAAPSQSPSSPQLVAEETVPYLLVPPTQQRYCSTDDVMRRTPTVDAPPPVACARTWQVGSSVPLVSAAMGRASPSSSSPSSPRLGRKRTASLTMEEEGPLRPPRRHCSLDDVMRRAPVVDAPPPVARQRVCTNYENILCETCGSDDGEDELILCDRCDRGYHTFCLRPIVAQVPIGPWLCPICDPPIQAPESFPVDKSKIFKFFGIQEDHEDEQDAQAANCGRSKNARRRRKSSLVMHKKERRIRPFVPSEDRARRLKQLASLATALTTSKTEFSNELTYMAPRSSNQARLEANSVQVLPKEDKENIMQCRIMQKRGEFPPLLVVFDSKEGFTVQADGNIKDMTFLAEYSGEVDYQKKREKDDCHYLMTLLKSANPSKDLVICANNRGNISRFFSGINNHAPGAKKKQNVKSVRYDIDGEIHVLWVACRDIACGDKLYCDYNEYEDAYPTQHFH